MGLNEIDYLPVWKSWRSRESVNQITRYSPEQKTSHHSPTAGANARNKPNQGENRDARNQGEYPSRAHADAERRRVVKG